MTSGRTFETLITSVLADIVALKYSEDMSDKDKAKILMKIFKTLVIITYSRWY